MLLQAQGFSDKSSTIAHVIIIAGGVGYRAGASVLKQFVEVLGPVLYY